MDKTEVPEDAGAAWPHSHDSGAVLLHGSKVAVTAIWFEMPEFVSYR